jgi:hypothetical protein
MTLSNRDCWQPVQEAVHDLLRRLRSGIANPTSNDDRAIGTVALSEPGASDELRQAANEPNGSCSTERCEIVLSDAILQAGVADLIQSNELVEAIRSTVGHEEPVKHDGESAFAERLDGPRFAKQSAPAGINTCCPLCE